MSQIPSFRKNLAPLLEYLDDPAVTEIAINEPQFVWLGRQGKRHMEGVSVPGLTLPLLDSLAAVTASYTRQDNDEKTPLLSATIPIDLRDGIADTERGGYRIQVILPPVVQQGTIGVCIRKPTLLDVDLDFYEEQGAFAQVNRPLDADERIDDTLAELYQAQRWNAFLKAAVAGRKNIVVSAGTNAGKTTALNAVLKHIGADERIVTIEDSREVRPPQKNRLHLVYSRGNQGVAKVTASDLLEALLRLAPDRAIIGELRGGEAYTFLEILNSGHTGSITTIHADSADLMYERLALMVIRGGTTLKKEDVIEYARSLIQVVVQFQRGTDGRRYISEIRYQHAA